MTFQQFPSFGFMPQFFQDLIGMMSSSGPVNWSVAEQMAVSVIQKFEEGKNVDPNLRIDLESIYRISYDRSVGLVEELGLRTDLRVLDKFEVITRSEWVQKSIKHLKPIFENVVIPQPSQEFQKLGELSSTELDFSNPESMAAMFSRLLESVAPTMLAMQFGSLIGHLAETSFGNYDLLLPRENQHEVALAGSNVARFAEEWSLDLPQLEMYVVTREIFATLVMTSPVLNARFNSLLKSYVKGLQLDSDRLNQSFQDIDLSNPENLESMLMDPSRLVDFEPSDEHVEAEQNLKALVAAAEGLIQFLTNEVGKMTIGDSGEIHEALMRRRLERGETEKFAETLFGFQMDQLSVDLGREFINGVIERVGSSGVKYLLNLENGLPTASEIDAPGLWIARIQFDGAEFDQIDDL